MSKWETKPLGSICSLKKGQQINLTELEKFGEYYVLNGGIDPSGYYNKFNTPPNVISISEGGNSCGYVNFNIKPFWSGGHNYTLINLTHKVSLSYLFQYLKYKQFDIMQLRQGSGLPNIQSKPLQEFLIKQPTSKIEADKIAEVLSLVDKNIEQTKSIIEKYKNIKLGLMHTLLNQQTNTTLSEFCSSVRDGTHDSPLTCNSIDSFPLVTSKNISGDDLDLSESYNISKEDYEKINKRSKVEQWDILFSMIGTIGSLYQVVDVLPQYAIKNVGLFKLNGNKIKSDYLKYYLQSQQCHKYIEFSLLGSTQKYASLTVLRKMPIFVPKKLEEVSEKLISIDNKITTEQKYLDKLLKLKQGLMQDLLTNKVSVLPLMKMEV